MVIQVPRDWLANRAGTAGLTEVHQGAYRNP